MPRKNILLVGDKKDFSTVLKIHYAIRDGLVK